MTADEKQMKLLVALQVYEAFKSHETSNCGDTSGRADRLEKRIMELLDLPDKDK